MDEERFWLVLVLSTLSIVIGAILTCVVLCQRQDHRMAQLGYVQRPAPGGGAMWIKE